MRQPEKVKPGELWAITAPASPASRQTVERAKAELEAWGYSVIVGESCYEIPSDPDSSVLSKSQELNHFFQDRDVKAILCLRGGYGSLKLLPFLNYEMIKENPKALVGFSDITALHIALQQRSRLATFHGPMGLQLSKGLDDFSRQVLLQCVSGLSEGDRLPLARKESLPEWLVPGTAAGILTGGNLSTLLSTLGTPYEIDTRDKILFLEEVHEEFYRIDRMITQLELAGKLDEARGFILGDFRVSVKEEGLLKSFLRRILRRQGKPAVYGVPAGHCEPNLTLPLGYRIQLDSARPAMMIQPEGPGDKE